MLFPNMAGEHSDTDEVLTAELTAAGIAIVRINHGRDRREVRTSVFGELCHWSFDRAWYYWVARGPGIPVEDAEALHAQYGKVVRVDGHCGCPHPRETWNGFGIGLYHVDTQEGLNALAATLRNVVARSMARSQSSPDGSKAEPVR